MLKNSKKKKPRKALSLSKLRHCSCKRMNTSLCSFICLALSIPVSKRQRSLSVPGFSEDCAFLLSVPALPNLARVNGQILFERVRVTSRAISRLFSQAIGVIILK